MSDFIDFKTLTRPPKPNTCLAAPKDLCENAKADCHPPALSQPAADAFASVVACVHQEKSWGKLVSDSDGLRLRFVATTGIMRFKDDVDIQLIAKTDSETDIAIYSRSRVGYSDLGANRKRVEKLLTALTRN